MKVSGEMLSLLEQSINIIFAQKRTIKKLRISEAKLRNKAKFEDKRVLPNSCFTLRL